MRGAGGGGVGTSRSRGLANGAGADGAAGGEHRGGRRQARHPGERRAGPRDGTVSGARQSARDRGADVCIPGAGGAAAGGAADADGDESLRRGGERRGVRCGRGRVVARRPRERLAIRGAGRRAESGHRCGACARAADGGLPLPRLARHAGGAADGRTAEDGAGGLGGGRLSDLRTVDPIGRRKRGVTAGPGEIKLSTQDGRAAERTGRQTGRTVCRGLGICRRQRGSGRVQRAHRPDAGVSGGDLPLRAHGRLSLRAAAVARHAGCEFPAATGRRAGAGGQKKKKGGE